MAITADIYWFCQSFYTLRHSTLITLFILTLLLFVEAAGSLDS